MAKRPDITTLASGFRSSNKLNDNFDEIKLAFENTISRDGSSPNQMEAPLDLNGQQIINLGEPLAPNDAARLADVELYNKFEELADLIEAEADEQIERIDDETESNLTAIELAGDTEIALVGAAGDFEVDRIEDLTAENIDDIEAAGVAAVSTVSAAANSTMYASTAAGIAATTNGQYFRVPVNGRAVVYENVSGVATERVVNPKYDDLAVVTGGQLGAVFVKDSDLSVDASYISRTDFGDQPSADVDLTDTTKREVALNTGIGSPTFRATAATVGGKLRVTYTFPANILASAITMERGVFNRVYKTAASVITQVTGAGQTQSWALGVCFSPTAPTPGATVGDAPADTVCIQMRKNSAIEAQTYNGFDAGATAPGVTLSVTTAPGGEWDPALPVDIEFIFTNDTCTEATVTFRQDKKLLANTDVTGLPPNPYVGVMSRSSGGDGDVVEYDDIVYFAPSIDIAKRIHLDPGVGAVGGQGTESNPFQTIGEAIDTYEIDRDRRELRITLRGGVWSDASLVLPSYFKRVEITGSRGTRPILRASNVIPVAAGWTLVSGNVWKLANPGNSRGVGGIIQTNTTSTFGQAGGYTAPYALYARHVPNTLATTLQPGEMTAHFSGTHAGSILVRAIGDVDPNTLSWRMSTRDTVIEALGTTGGWNDQVVKLRNLNVEDGYIYGGRFDQVEVDIEDVIFQSTMVGFGVDFKDTVGSVRNTISQGTYFDCIHANDSAESVKSVLRFDEVIGRGGFYYVNNGLSTFADAWSNHFGNEWHLHSCQGNSGGKDGFSLADNARLVNCDADDNKDSGIKLSGTTANVKTADIRGGRLTGNGQYGTLVVGTNVGENLSAVLDNVYFRDNLVGHVRIDVDGTGNIDLIRPCFDNIDSTPTNGNTSIAGGTMTNRGQTELT